MSQEQLDTTADKAERTSDAKKLRILVVDDSATIRRSAETMLTKEGCEVITAENGFGAILAVEEQKPDVVITDIMMPRLTGLEFLKAIKNNPATAEVPVFLISAMDQADMVQQGLDLGAADYITKPFKINEIIGKLRHLRP